MKRFAYSILVIVFSFSPGFMSCGSNELLKEPLFNAVISGKIQTVDSLLRNGYDINQQSGKKKQTVLHVAVNQSYDLNMITYLIRKSPALNIKDYEGNTPLHYAMITFQNKDLITKLLLDNGADMYLKNNKNQTAWDCLWDIKTTRFTKNELNIVIYFLDKNYKLNINETEPETGKKWIHKIAQKCDVGDLIEKLISEYKTDVNSVDRNGWTPLHYAVKSKNYLIAEDLLENNAFVNSQTTRDVEPIYSKGKIIDYQFPKGTTPLDINFKVPHFKREESMGSLLNKFNALTMKEIQAK